MMSSTSKSAVSDYEHLNYRHTAGDTIGLNESDEDQLFLKAPTPTAFVDTLKAVLNENNSNSARYSLKSNNHLNNQFGTINDNIPVPSSFWSPGMAIQPNPALLITPEKTGKSVGKNYPPLQDYSVKRVPQPVPYSPVVRPEKSIFITPDKNDLKNNSKTVRSEFRPSQTSTSEPMMTEKSNKEKQTVRFDLPSFSSGEDTFFDEDSCLFSPVTVKGKDLTLVSCGEDISEAHPQPFSSLKPHVSKSYNPNVYSDDSTMDESVLTSQKSAAKSQRSQHQNEDISLSTSAHLFNKLKEIMQDSTLSGTPLFGTTSDSLSTMEDTTKESTIPEASDVHSSKSSKISKPTKTSSTLTSQLKDKNAHSSQIKVIRENQSKDKSHSSSVSVQSKKKQGPHFLKDPVSAYHPPSNGSCIIKEPHHSVDPFEYSYPFQDGSRGDGDNQTEHAFARPEFNSTLKFRQELNSICDQEIDVIRAVQEKFKETSQVKTEIQEKAASQTNCTSDQFANLIDLDPPVDRLCERVLRMRTSKVVKKKKMPPEKAASGSLPANVPDLMEFYSPDLQRETPGFSLQGIAPVTPDLLSASSDLAFDVYRHSRVWDGLSDY